jgi:hypothetical protein
MRQHQADGHEIVLKSSSGIMAVVQVSSEKVSARCGTIDGSINGGWIMADPQTTPELVADWVLGSCGFTLGNG